MVGSALPSARSSSVTTTLGALVGQPDRRPSDVRLADNPDPVVGFERRPEADPKDGMGIDEETRHAGGKRGLHQSSPE
jgi:hypothetical protein